MDNKTTKYDQKMAEYRERMLRRNRQLAEDDDDIIESIINQYEPVEPPKKREFTAPVRTNMARPVAPTVKPAPEANEPAPKLFDASPVKEVAEPAPELDDIPDTMTTEEPDEPPVMPATVGEARDMVAAESAFVPRVEEVPESKVTSQGIILPPFGKKVKESKSKDDIPAAKVINDSGPADEGAQIQVPVQPKKPTADEFQAMDVEKDVVPQDDTQEFEPVKRVAVPYVEPEYDETDYDDDLDDVEEENSFAAVADSAKAVAASVGEGAKKLASGVGEAASNLVASVKSGKISTRGKWFIAAVALLIVFVIVTSCYVSAVQTYKYNQMDIREIAESDLTVNEGVASAVEGYTTIALYGVDSRDETLDAGTNSDAIILVSINNDTKEIKLVSVYRDTLLQIQSESLTTQKVNYAYQLGGSLMSINTLNANFDLYITDYITVDFSAMAEIIDAMGGVIININENEINNLNKNLAEQIKLSGTYSDGVHEAGVQILNGQQAVAYSRIRSTGLGDITRTERQRAVLLALFETASSMNASNMSDLLDVSFSCISTSFTKKEMTNLVKDISSYSIVDTTGFPFTYEALSIDGKGSVLAAADLDTNVSALHEYLYGDSDYIVSATVSEINAILTAETNVAATQTSATTTTDTTDDDTASADVTTITDAPEGMIENE